MYKQWYKKEKEISVISFSYTIVHPRTMMIKSLEKKKKTLVTYMQYTYKVMWTKLIIYLFTTITGSMYLWVSEGIQHSVVRDSALIWFIRYIHYWNLQFLLSNILKLLQIFWLWVYSLSRNMLHHLRTLNKCFFLLQVN